MKINIQGFNDKKTKTDKSFDLNTTAEFGFIQPTLVEEVIPKSSYNLKQTTLVQCQPLLSPTFARMRLVQLTSFVPMNDIFHHWREVVTGRKMTHGSSSNLVTSAPTVKYADLITFMLNLGCVCSVWTNGAYEGHYYSTLGNFVNYNWINDEINFKTIDVTSTSSAPGATGEPAIPDLTANHCILLRNCMHYNASTDSYDHNLDTHWADGTIVYNANPLYVQRYGDMPTLDNADYVLKDSSTGNYLLFRLSQQARNFRKVLIGLGYNIDINVLFAGETSSANNTLANLECSLLPFMAYYKAWFDLMYPKRDINFANTNCGQLIEYLDRTSTSGSVRQLGTVWLFLRDVSNMTYVYNNDYYTSHLSDLGTSSDDALLGYSLPYQSSSNAIETRTNAVPYLHGSQVIESFTQTHLKILAALNNFALSGTVIGKRVEDYLRSRGVYSSDDTSNFICSHSLDIDTGTVMSTVINDNVELGQKGGHAHGAGKNDGFKYTATDYGYIVSFMCIVGKSGFSQGMDPKNFRKTRYDFYTQEFDGLGYRLTPSYEYFSSYDCADSGSIPSMSAIGFTGRYNDYKYKTNIANGDFTRRPTKNDIGSFYLDKRIPTMDFRTISVSTSGTVPYTKIGKSDNDVPMPTSALRFLNNEYFDFNRIFVNRDDVEVSVYARRFYDPIDDHFTIQQVNDFVAFMPVKPISDSLGTDDAVDNYSATTSTQMS